MSTKSTKNVRMVAYCAVFSALSILILYLGSLLEILDLSCGAIASFVIVFAIIELDKKWAIAIWVVTSVLSLILLPDKFLALVYFVCCGIYPILKSLFERCNKILQWVIKLLYFNIVMAIAIAVSKYVLLVTGLDDYLIIPIILIGNLAFVLYDIAITRLVKLYFFKYRKVWKIDKLIKK